MKRHTPSLQALKAFEATARLLSFKQAAKELNVTHSAISHQIKKLEENLGKPLFERLGRRIVLTDVGEQYVLKIRQALLDIEDSTQQIFGDPDKGELSVQVYLGIASRWLLPRLGSFRGQYPDIHVALQSAYFGWEFSAEDADIGIVYTEQKTDESMYKQLFKGVLMPVCSPELLAEKDRVTLEELLVLPFINVTESPMNLPLWLQSAGIERQQINVVSEQDNHQLAIEAAIAGKGVAVVQSFFASGDLASGNLIVPFDLPVPEIGQWYTLQSQRSLADPKVNYFINWILHNIQQDKSLARVD